MRLRGDFYNHILKHWNFFRLKEFCNLDLTNTNKMKLAFNLLLILFLPLFFQSCIQDDVDSRGLLPSGNCQRELWEANDEGTACICPPETHFELPLYEGIEDHHLPFCRPKEDRYYYFTATDNCCLNNGEFKGYNEIGLATVFFPNQGDLLLSGGDGSSLYSEYARIFTPIGLGFPHGHDGIQEQMDGSFKIHFRGFSMKPENCSNLAEASSRCDNNTITVETTGQSTVDRKEIDLTLVWRDCDGEVIDTGAIHMWRDW